ncbi:MAG: MbcA/ParS/Xre antitoxin family protein [Gammaproteobacteria bacterium]|nr:MbcA/ParS/Xre antitoxin family protein [Gammaproteobacteria bacterium]
MEFQEFVENQVFSPALVATALRTTKTEIANTLGLGQDAFSRASRIRATKTQTRLRQMLEILHRVSSHTGSDLAAYAWFRAEPLPGFGGVTPDQLVREGKADDVHAHLDRVMAGGYA